MSNTERAVIIEALLKMLDFGVDTEFEDLIVAKLRKLIEGILV